MSGSGNFGIADLFNMESGTANLYSQGGSSGGAAFEERGQENVRRVGRSNQVPSFAKLLPGIDVARALQRDVSVDFTMDRKMSPEKAGEMVSSILNRCGMMVEDDANMYAFIKAMCLCMAANSASVLIPGRSEFFVGESRFDFFTDVMSVLGNNARRFFRAYADFTRAHLLDLETEFQHGPRSESAQDVARYERVTGMWHNILEVAADRGLTRVPYLVHDSSQSCTKLTAVERTYLANCKSTIFANGAYLGNLVDNPVVSNNKGSSRNMGPVVSSSGFNASGMPEGF